MSYLSFVPVGQFIIKLLIIALLDHLAQLEVTLRNHARLVLSTALRFELRGDEVVGVALFLELDETRIVASIVCCDLLRSRGFVPLDVRTNGRVTGLPANTVRWRLVNNSAYQLGRSITCAPLLEVTSSH